MARKKKNKPRRVNPVAKHLRRFNRHQVIQNRKLYSRKEKHRSLREFDSQGKAWFGVRYGHGPHQERLGGRLGVRPWFAIGISQGKGQGPA